MESLVDSIIDFARVRLLNFVVAFILTAGYLAYQYWGLLTKPSEDEDECSSPRHSRSRSRSCSKSRTKSGYHDYKVIDSKHGRRGRKPYTRCPNCSLCNFDE